MTSGAAGALLIGSARGGRACAGHPAVFCYAVGNEIPASIVRLHGARNVERFLEGLYRAAKAEDPESLVTYVNFPTTEYLQLPFLDFYCFNVYLETRERLEAYLARLQNLAGDKPLVMAEVGLDSRRNGRESQAQILDWQIRSTFAAGCAGMFVFSWTDKWHRGGYDIEDSVDAGKSIDQAVEMLEAQRQRFEFLRRYDLIDTGRYWLNRNLKRCLVGEGKVVVLD